MPDTKSELETRVYDLERHVYRLLLIIGAAGAMLAEVRCDEGDEA
jgi:hypothetical protein